MKNITDHHGDEVTLHDLAYMLYQAFGAQGVHNALWALRDDLPNVVWDECKPCEGEYPHEVDHEGEVTCLVCGTVNER
jgi:hypothetical protein